MDIRQLIAEMRILNNGRVSKYGTVSVISEKAIKPIEDTEVVIYSEKLRPYASDSYQAVRHHQGIQVIGPGNRPMMTVPVKSYLDFRLQKVGKLLPSGYVIYPKLDGRFLNQPLEQVALGKPPNLQIKRPFVQLERPDLIGKELVVIEKNEKECIVFDPSGKIIPHQIAYPLAPEHWEK